MSQELEQDQIGGELFVSDRISNSWPRMAHKYSKLDGFQAYIPHIHDIAVIGSYRRNIKQGHISSADQSHLLLFAPDCLVFITAVVVNVVDWSVVISEIGVCDFCHV